MIERIASQDIILLNFYRAYSIYGQCRRSAADAYGHPVEAFRQCSIHDALDAYDQDEDHRESRHENDRFEDHIYHDTEVEQASKSFPAFLSSQLVFEDSEEDNERCRYDENP